MNDTGPFCGFCAHWDQSAEYSQRLNIGYCDVLSDHDVIYVEGEKRHAYAIDTAPDFGCNRWISKTASQHATT